MAELFKLFITEYPILSTILIGMLFAVCLLGLIDLIVLLVDRLLAICLDIKQLKYKWRHDRYQAPRHPTTIDQV